ncbi:hypothetical protein SRABI128_06161 [Microbacterium sp. Bi128]|nr:hypothetical protein SRABI128_06161 [Microbacterium sp. Bi128]
MRLDVDGEFHEQRGGPAQGIGADAAVGKLGEERQVRAAQFTADDAGGLGRVLARPGAKGGRGHLARCGRVWYCHG